MKVVIVRQLSAGLKVLMLTRFDVARLHAAGRAPDALTWNV